MTGARSPVGAVLAAAAALTLVLALASPAQSATVRIRGSNARWHPRSATITRGTVVRWTAVDTSHTVTSYAGHWSKDVRLSAGSSTRYRFRRTGTFKFYCMIHGSVTNGVCTGMCGKVVVTSG